YAAEGQQEQIILLKCFINSSKTIFLLTANGTQDLSSIENLTFKDMETCAKVKSGCQNTEVTYTADYAAVTAKCFRRMKKTDSWHNISADIELTDIS
ncbi:hypothetical protein pdam_00024984, partial [Pocillopora damicornis]